MSTLVGQYEPTELFCLWTKVHLIFSPNVKGVAVDQVFSDVRYVDPFRRYSRSEIAPNFGGFFFAFPNFRGWAFQKLYQFYHPYLATHRLKKFCEDTRTSPEVISARSACWPESIISVRSEQTLIRAVSVEWPFL